MALAELLARSMPGIANEQFWLEDSEFVDHMWGQFMADLWPEARKVAIRLPFRDLLHVACMIDAGAFDFEAWVARSRAGSL